MTFLLATLLLNHVLLRNFIIILICLALVLTIQFVARKVRRRSIKPLEKFLKADPDSKSEEKKEVASPSKESIIKGLMEDLIINGLEYDKKQDSFSTRKDSWQNEYGYCRLYDESAAMQGIIYDCEVIPFDFNGKHWIISLQKGQYCLSTGAEISVYNTARNPILIPSVFNGTFYDCIDEEDQLIISFTLLKNNDTYLNMHGSSWCVNAFRLGDFSDPRDLYMHIKITFPTNSMCLVFSDSLINMGYQPEDITILSNTVYFVFDEPKSPQPLTRNILTTFIMQRNNEQYINAYQYISQDFSTTLTKLTYLKYYFPEMYKEVIAIGKPKDMFLDYEDIKEHLNN